MSEVLASQMPQKLPVDHNYVLKHPTLNRPESYDTYFTVTTVQTPREATPQTSEAKIPHESSGALSPCPDCILEDGSKIEQSMLCERCDASGTIQPNNFNNGANLTKVEAADLEADFQDGTKIKGAFLKRQGTSEAPAHQMPQESPAQTPREATPRMLEAPAAQMSQESQAQTLHETAVQNVCENPAVSAGVAPPPPPSVAIQIMVPIPQVVMPDFYETLEMDPLCESCGMADPQACCLATWCPCMAVGEIAEAVDMDYTDACCAYAAMCVFCGPECANCVHGCGLAQKLRQHYNVNTHENGCMTCCCHCVTDPKSCLMGRWNLFCCSFALTQELRFARKVKANQSPNMAGPVRQMMLPSRM